MEKRGFWSKIKKNLLKANKPEKEEQKETTIKEKPSAFGTEEEDTAEQINADLSQSTIEYLYNNSVLLKRYIKIIVDECLRYSLVARPKKGFEDNKTSIERANKLNRLLLQCNAYETFREVREKYLKDLLLYARAGLEIEPSESKDAFPKALYAAPGYCIKMNTDDAGNFEDLDKAYIIVDPDDTSKTIATFPYHSLVYFVYDRISDRVYGESPLKSIYYELQADLKASEGLKKGVSELKTGLVCLKKAPRRVLKDTITKFLSAVRTNARAKLVAVNTEDVKFVDLTNIPTKDLIELQKWVALKANVYNIPPFKLGLGIDTGSLTAREQRDDFKGLIENILFYEIDKLNAILVIARLGWDDIEITCPDLATKLSYERARIAVRLVNGGVITPNEARVKYLGLDPVDDPSANQLKIPKESNREE